MKLHIPDKLHPEIIPGILEPTWEGIERKIEIVKPFAKHIHIDFLDGVFAPNKTFMDPAPFAKYKDSGITFELHMMVEDPLQYVESFANVGFTRFIGQIELMGSQVDFVAKAQEYGEVGLAVDSPSPIDLIEVPYEDLDFLFVMTVKAGFSNQSFLPEMLEKVEAMRAKNQFIPIEVDGGVKDGNIEVAKAAGATRFVSTGYLFGSEHPEKQYQMLASLVK